mgnify:CR=1 FL=1
MVFVERCLGDSDFTVGITFFTGAKLHINNTIIKFLIWFFYINVNVWIKLGHADGGIYF